MDFEAKNIMWMTSKSVYEATFAEFSAVNHINYEYFSDGVDVYNEDIVKTLLSFMSLAPQMQL
jgi:hypothetical protein